MFFGKWESSFPAIPDAEKRKSGNTPSVANTPPSTLMVQWKMDA